MTGGSQSFKKKKEVTYSKDLGKFKCSASTAGEEEETLKKIYRQDSLWQCCLSVEMKERQKTKWSQIKEFQIHSKDLDKR